MTNSRLLIDGVPRCKRLQSPFGVGWCRLAEAATAILLALQQWLGADDRLRADPLQPDALLYEVAKSVLPQSGVALTVAISRAKRLDDGCCLGWGAAAIIAAPVRF